MGVIVTLLILMLTFNTVAKVSSESVTISYSNISLRINGELKSLKDANGNTVEPFVLNGTTYIPIRPMAGLMGYDVMWDDGTKTIHFYDGNYTPTMTQASKPTAAPTPTPSAATTQDAMEQEVLRLVNEERGKAGLSPLTTNSQLTQATRLRAKELVSKYSHDRPDGRSCFSVLADFGLVYQTVGENIAYGQESAKQVMNSWMNSQGHRENILNKDYKEIGIGAYTDNGTTYWVQLFMTSIND